MDAPRTKPSLLLHTCCGPCASHAVDVVRPDYAVTLFFSNSNIFPEEEYRRRLEQARRLSTLTGCPLIEDLYDHGGWLAAIRGLEEEPEKGRRCDACFAFNLERTAARVRGGGFHRFTTTLTISPHKVSRRIFELGARYPEFLAIDFKKKGGFRHSIERSRAYGLYRQDYCGCEFSLAARRDGR